MYKHVGRLFFGAQAPLGIQPVFGGYSEEGAYTYLRFIPSDWAIPENPAALYGESPGRFAYCEVKLHNLHVKLQIGLLNEAQNDQGPLFDAFQDAEGELTRLPKNKDTYPKYWETTILTHQGKTRSKLELLNWPTADIDHYLGAQIASKLSEILKSTDFKAASAQVLVTLG